MILFSIYFKLKIISIDHILDLTIISLDTTITNSDNRLMAVQEGASYQWLDCNAGNIPIVGATDRIFIPESNGSYAVEITMNGCSEVSECVSFLIDEAQIEIDEKAIFPNPSRKRLNVNLDKAHQNVVLQILTSDNRMVITKRVNSPEELFIDIEHVPAGIYFLKIESSRGTFYRKIIKQ